MGKIFKVSPEVKDQIINRIKNEGVTVADAAKEHGITTRCIYKWLGGSVSAPTFSEVSKLKRENKALLELVGEMSFKLSETQKKN